MAFDIKSLLGELVRRKVLRAGGFYLVAAWGISTGAAELLPAFGAPDWTVPTLTIIAFLGLPIVIIAAWYFDLSTAGLVRDAGPAIYKSPSKAPSLETLGEPATTIMLSPSALRAYVRWSDEGQEKQASFNGDFLIGRDPVCDVQFDNGAVSRRHARVFFISDQWFVEDLNSQNGTFINEVRIEKQPLGAQTEVRLSDDGPMVWIDIESMTEIQVQ